MTCWVIKGLRYPLATLVTAKIFPAFLSNFYEQKQKVVFLKQLSSLSLHFHAWSSNSFISNCSHSYVDETTSVIRCHLEGLQNLACCLLLNITISENIPLVMHWMHNLMQNNSVI